MTARIITANLLSNGTVVYLNQLFDWSSEISAARVLTSDSEIEEVLQIIRRAKIGRDVVGVQAEDIQGKDGIGTFEQLRFHEHIRAQAPAIKSAA